jgi:hypothetical protein
MMGAVPISALLAILDVTFAVFFVAFFIFFVKVVVAMFVAVEGAVVVRVDSLLTAAIFVVTEETAEGVVFIAIADWLLVTEVFFEAIFDGKFVIDGARSEVFEIVLTVELPVDALSDQGYGGI